MREMEGDRKEGDGTETKGGMKMDEGEKEWWRDRIEEGDERKREGKKKREIEQKQTRHQKRK